MGVRQGRRRLAWSGRTWIGFVPVLAAVMVSAAAPAAAHEEHRRQRAAAMQAMQAAEARTGAPGHRAPDSVDPAVNHMRMVEAMEPPRVDRTTMSFWARLFDWIGRLHPILVHFPIAFFPAALLTAIVGRRRPAFAQPVQFLVVAGGIIAPVAAVLGWIDGGFAIATDDWMLAYHRWLGTGIGVGALGLAIWALRKPEQDRGPSMIVALTIMTVAIVAQGWFGGALVHGIGHMGM